MRGLGAANALAISALPIHDANGAVLNAFRQPDFEAAPRRPHFVGLFLLDPFRRMDALLEAVRAAGVTGIANLPTVDAFTGELRAALAHVGLCVERETEALERAEALGLRSLRLACTEDGEWLAIDRKRIAGSVLFP